LIFIKVMARLQGSREFFLPNSVPLLISS
jgi:hypothetical protein